MDGLPSSPSTNVLRSFLPPRMGPWGWFPKLFWLMRLFDVSHLGRGEVGSNCPFSPCYIDFPSSDWVQPPPSESWAPQLSWVGSERQGWSPLEKDHSFCSMSGVGAGEEGSQAVGTQPGVRGLVLFMSHPDVSHFLRSGNPVVTRSRACYGSHVPSPQQMDISIKGWRMEKHVHWICGRG